MEVKMNKEIMDYREAMFFGLDFRQMACSLLAVLAAVGIYFSLRKTAGEEVTGWLCMLGAAPFAFCGFFRYHGMTAEQFAWAVVKSELLYPKRLLFQPEDLYYQCMEGRIASGENGKREKKAEKLRRKELKKARKQAAARKRIQRKQTGRKQATRKRMDRQTSGKRESREPIMREQRNRKQSGRMQAERDQMKKMRSGRKQCSRVQEEREHAVFMHPSGNPARGIRTDRSPRLEMGTVSTDQKRMDSKQSTGSRRNRMPTNQDQRNRTPAHRNSAQNPRNKSSIQQPIRRRRDASD